MRLCMAVVKNVPVGAVAVRVIAGSGLVGFVGACLDWAGGVEGDGKIRADPDRCCRGHG